MPSMRVKRWTQKDAERVARHALHIQNAVAPMRPVSTLRAGDWVRAKGNRGAYEYAYVMGTMEHGTGTSITLKFARGIPVVVDMAEEKLQRVIMEVE